MKYDIIVDYNGDKFYYKPGTVTGIGTGILHREDGPAIEYTNGNKYWYQNGELHRINGPAIEYTNGNMDYKDYYINGKQYSKKEYWYIIKNNLYVLL